MLTPNQQKALAAMLTHPTKTAAAAACGLTDRTLAMYEQNPEFSAALREGREKALTEAANSLSSCYPAAVVALREVVEDTGSPAAVRVQAARSLLEYGLRFTQTGEGPAVSIVFIDDVPPRPITEQEGRE